MASSGREGGAYPASASAHLRKLAHWARPSTITQGTPFLSVLHCPRQLRSSAASHSLQTKCSFASLKRSAIRCELFWGSSSTAIDGAVLRARPWLMRDVFSQPEFYECYSGYVSTCSRACLGRLTRGWDIYGLAARRRDAISHSKLASERR
jgi:hypothetical protein